MLLAECVVWLDEGVYSFILLDHFEDNMKSINQYSVFPQSMSLEVPLLSG